MQIEMIKTDSLIPYVNNSRTHSDKQIDQIAASIKEFGFNNPILLDGEKGVIAGHGRLMAAKKLNLGNVPCIELKHLSPSQKKAYVIADNRIALNAGWDTELLSIDLKELAEENFELDILGFDDKELDKLLEPEVVEGNTDDDAIPENVETRCKPGDIWQLGNHRLMCGDSTNVQHVDLLLDGNKIDMVFTDPPYGVNYEGGHFHSGDVNIKRKRKPIQSDESADIYTKIVPILASYCEGPIYTWYADSHGKQLYNAIDEVGQYHSMIVWHKINAKYGALNANYKKRHEPCVYWKAKGKNLKWCGATTESTIWEIKKDPKNDLHPTQKPVALAEKAIMNHSVGHVMDLFLGSGSTLIACEKTNRKCFGMEIDPDYCDVILKRWEDFTGKKAELLNG